MFELKIVIATFEQMGFEVKTSENDLYYDVEVYNAEGDSFILYCSKDSRVFSLDVFDRIMNGRVKG